MAPPRRKVATLSTESIAGPAASEVAACPSCGAPLAADQRYCLQCGERVVPISSFLLGDPPAAAATPPQSPPASPPMLAPNRDDGAGSRGTALTLIAGVGVLLLAMGVGVLIGRADAPRQSAAPAQVISVATAPSGAAAPAAEATFSSDWPPSTSGYTVELQTLPVAGTAVAAVEAAKTAATAKGAKAVGALKSEEFSSLTAGSYVIYSGEYHSRADAEKALTALKKSFPEASVKHISNGASSGSSSSTSTSGSGVGSSESHPAPASVLKTESKAKGKSYEEQSKNLPDVVETG